MATIAKEPDTTEMLRRLQFSANENTAEIAKAILNKEVSIKEQLKYCGGFLQAVLKNDYKTALTRADAFNQIALLTPLKYDI